MSSTRPRHQRGVTPITAVRPPPARLLLLRDANIQELTFHKDLVLHFPSQSHAEDLPHY